MLRRGAWRPAPEQHHFNGTTSLRWRRLLADTDAAQIVTLVARSRNVDARMLFRRSRGVGEVAAARQLAMYLVHVLLGRRQQDVATLFGRDRTTVGHACRIIEDLRDDPILEAEIVAIESARGAAEGARHAA